MLETLKENSLEEAKTALLTSPVFALRSLDVKQIDHALVITGTVSSYYHKQLAQEVVRSVADGMLVVNSVAVLERILPAADEHNI